MLGLSLDVIVHRLPLNPHIRQVAQVKRKFSPRVEFLIVAKIEKLKAAKFIPKT